MSFLKISPKNYLNDWGEFESWQAETVAPDGWTSSSSPLIQQETTIKKFGNYSARLVGSGALGGLIRTIPDGSDYQGRTFSLGFWARSASTGPYIQLNDGVAVKTLHLDGLNAMAFHTIPPMKIDYAATKIEIALLASAQATAYFDSGILCEGEFLMTTFDDNIVVSEMSPSINMRQDIYELSQRSGAFIPDSIPKSKTLKLSGSVVGSDTASTRTHFDGLMKALISQRASEKKELHIQDERVLEVFVKNVESRFVAGANMIRYSAQIEAPDASARFIGKIRKSQYVQGTSIKEFNLSYNGTSQTRPIVSFIASEGVITTCQLENLTTQETIAYTGTVPNGVALNIDCFDGTVFNSGISRVSDFGTSDFISLVHGTNYFRFSGSECRILIDYFERYL